MWRKLPRSCRKLTCTCSPASCTTGAFREGRACSWVASASGSPASRHPLPPTSPPLSSYVLLNGGSVCTQLALSCCLLSPHIPSPCRDEARCLKLLHFLHGRMAPGAALLIGEMLLPGEGEDPSVVGDGAALQDINMLVGVVESLVRRVHVWGARMGGQ